MIQGHKLSVSNYGLEAVLRKPVVILRGNILHAMDVMEKRCILYKRLDLGFI